MKVSFEFTTENENRNDLLLVAEFCNALAGNAKQPVLSATIEPEAEKQPVKTVAEIIAEERAKTASMKAAAPAVNEPEQISEDAAAKHYEELKAEEAAAKKAEAEAKKAEAAAKRAAAKAEKEAAAKLEAERQAETDRLTAEAAKLEAKRVADEAAAKEAEAAAAAKEAEAAAAAPAPQQVELTVKDCRDLAMKALNKQRKDLVQEAFAKVGCQNFPTLEKKPEMFAAFMEHINTGLNA